MHALPLLRTSAADLNQRQYDALARYHFNIRNGHGFTADNEGMDLSSEDEARRHAITGARSLLSAEVLEGTLDLNGQIEVTDDHQASVMTVHFVEVVDVQGIERLALGDR